MAHKKAAGSVKNGRDSISKRLGVKVFGSESVNTGQVLVRQRGTKFHPGKNVKRTSDDTLIATIDGVLEFVKKKVYAFNGNLKKRTYLNVVPNIEVQEVKKPAKKAPAKKAAPKKEVAKKETASTAKKTVAKKTTTKKTTKAAAKTTTKKATKKTTAKK